MATPKEQLSEKIKTLNNFEAVEALDFIEYLEQKRAKELKEFLNNVDTDDELNAIKTGQKDLAKGETLSFDEVFGKDE
ncbi:MAG: hypothetical protein WCK67_10135 [bacterium]